MAEKIVEFNLGQSAVAILTHRRGVGILISRDAQYLQTIAECAALEQNLCENDTDLYTHPQGMLGFSRTTTAEKLAFLYQKILTHMHLNDSDIHQMIVGMGPGSFTGLRLGCAFANGLALGRPRPLFGMQMLSDRGDNFTGLVDEQDFKLALNNFPHCFVSINGFFVPAYGKEPGPVLKLQGLL